MQNGSLDHQTPWHSASNLSKITSAQRWHWGTLARQTSPSCTRHRTDEVPHIDAGSHFARENTGLRAISTIQTWPRHSSSAMTASQITLQLRRPPRNLSTSLVTLSISNLSSSLLSPSLICPHPYSHHLYWLSPSLISNLSTSLWLFIDVIIYGCDCLLLWLFTVVTFYCCDYLWLCFLIVVIMFCCDSWPLWLFIVVIPSLLCFFTGVMLYCCDSLRLWLIVVIIHFCDDVLLWFFCCDVLLLWLFIVVFFWFDCFWFPHIEIRNTEFRLLTFLWL